MTKFSEISIRCLYYLFRVFPIQKNKIVFCNYLGKGYGCNPKYIAQEILTRNENWDLVWLVNDMNYQFPVRIRAVKYESIKGIYELATAGVWIDNQRKLPYHRKRKHQFFIETWHGGGGPIKKIGADNPRNFNNIPYEKTSKHMDKIVDLMLSNSACCSEIYRSAFLYTGEIFECGYPRNDILISNNDDVRIKVYNYFNLDPNQKTVLYAPTYRNERSLDTYQLDIEGVLNALKNRFEGSWNLLLRLHPTMLKKAYNIQYKNVINACYYDDMQELLASCDILISDYSCTISEFALTGKYVFLFATDINEYAAERDFYCDYYSLPFPISDNNEALLDNIQCFSEKEYKEKVDKYLYDVRMFDNGTASKQVVDKIEMWLRRR